MAFYRMKQCLLAKPNGQHLRTLHASDDGLFESKSCTDHVMRIEPLGEKIVVKRTDAEEVTSGGIVLPDSAQEKPAEGKVLSVGEGRMLADGSRAKPQVSEGDRVLFSSYAGTEIDVDGQDLLIMSETDILAVVN